MADEKKFSLEDDFDLDFLSSDIEKIYRDENSKYKILIVDDDDEIHKISKMVLEDFRFKDSKLQLLHSRSCLEAKEAFIEHKDIALVLLDVVMEEEDSGLRLVNFIRKEIKNRFVRIILRTGQPGKAPEDKIIREYDINDYKEKTELTVSRLYTSIYSALRAYEDIIAIHKAKEGLERVMIASNDLLTYRKIHDFAEGILEQMINLMEFKVEKNSSNIDSFVILKEKKEKKLISKSGKYVDMNNMEFFNEIDDILKSVECEGISHQEEGYVWYYKSLNKIELYIFIEGKDLISELDLRLLGLYLNSFSLVFERFLLNQDMLKTQKEIIYTLGEVVETRSDELVNHIRRVSEISYLMAQKYGLSEEDCEMLRDASPLHDVGKVAIEDSVLKKPGKLTDEEFNRMKEHTEIGYKILSKSDREILKIASEVAYYHHEKWDGTGYPEGLKEEDIPVYARIVAAADVFDALLHKRVYKDAWSIDQVVELFQRERGRHFDPKVVDILLRDIDEFKYLIDLYKD